MTKGLWAFLCATLCVSIVSAQPPQRIWSQSFFTFSRAFLYDRDSNELFVIGNGTVYRLDVQSNAVVAQYSIAGQTLGPYQVFNDTVLVASRQYELQMLNLRTGSPITVPDSVRRRYRFVDQNSHAGVYQDWPDSAEHVLVIVDLETFKVLATIAHGVVEDLAIDRRSGYLFGKKDGYIVRLSTGGRVDTVKALGPTNTYFASAVVLADGDILMLTGDVQSQLGGQQLHHIDGQRLEIVRSRSISGGNQVNNALQLIDDKRVILHHTYDSATVINVETLDVLQVLHVSDGEILNLTANRGMPIVAIVDGNVIAFSEDLTSSERIWDDRSPIGDVAQLWDGRVVVSTSYEPLHVLDILTGLRTDKVWNREKPVKMYAAKSILPSKSEPWVAMGDGANGASIVSVETVESRCTLLSEDNINGVSDEDIDLAIDWIDASAEASICSFNRSTRGPYSTGIHAFPAPCRDTTVRPSQGPISYSDCSIDFERGVRSVANADASIVMIPIRGPFYRGGNEVRIVYDVLNGGIGKNDYISIKDANHPLFTSDDTYGVVDHALGLLRFDPRDPSDTSTHHVIVLGSRVIPMASVPRANIIIVHDTTAHTLVGVDVVTDAITWAIPLTLSPYQIIVDRNARWMLVHDKSAALEMYALDTAVSVKEQHRERSSVLHTIYPNPSSTEIYIQPADSDSYVLMNSLGERVAEGVGGVVPVTTLSSGPYLLQITRDKTTEVHQVIVQR